GRDRVGFCDIGAEYARKTPAYVSWWTARLVAVSGAALADVRRARLPVRQTTAPFAHNRRGAAAVDHDVPVLEVTADDGRRRAVVFGYACHNTTMPPEDGRYCGDYAGFAQVALEADDPTAVALFVAGAGADQNPDPRGTLELARQHGHTLAEAVRRCLAGGGNGREITGPLQVAYEEIPLPFQPLPTREALLTDRVSGDRPTRTKAEYLLARLEERESLP